MTSDHILKLLRAKHSEDVFVSQCKDGPSQSVGSFGQIDAWVMPRSWSHPHLSGYEIKVSRQDFIGDEKWRKYLPMCNYLYFAAPPGIIGKDELPPEVGLYEVSTGGARIFLKKKAMYRQIEEPASVFRYVLMGRATVGPERSGAVHHAFWKQWAEQKKASTSFGHMVSKKIRETLRVKVDEVECRQRELESQIRQYAEIRALLKRLDLSEDCSSWNFENKLTALRRGMTGEERRTLTNAASYLQSAIEVLTTP